MSQIIGPQFLSLINSSILLNVKRKRPVDGMFTEQSSAPSDCTTKQSSHMGEKQQENKHHRQQQQRQEEDDEEGRSTAKKLKRTPLVIKPSEYALAAFRANGVKIDEARKQCVTQFPSMPCDNVEQTDAYTSEVLEAIRRGDLTMLENLDTMKKLNVNACNRWGDSLLHLACRRSHTKIVDFLLKKGVNVHIRDDYHRTPLHDAAWTTEPNFELIDLLLNQGGACYQILMPDVRGFTPFDYVRQEHGGQWLRFLWERKAILKV